MKKFLLILLVLFLSGCQSGPVKPEVNSVYYEIYVGSFYDSDGDGMGDLNGVTEKLDYIQELGATGIWLMPINPSPTYHKYDVMDYQAIDEDYGTMEDFDKLVEEMEKRDMDLILDLVLNHSSSKHPWFLSAVSAHINDSCDVTPECDYYHFQSESAAGFTQLSTDLYYESVFWDQMPDLNLDNEQVREEIDEIVTFWLDKGVHGFRLDATTHFYRENVENNVEFLSWFNDLVKEKKPDAYLVGEAWSADSIVTQMYESQVDSFFNFTLSQVSGSIVRALNTGNGIDLANYVASYEQTIKEKNPEALNAVFLSNHDNNRSAGYLSNDLAKQKQAASLYLLMPGNVFIYYGEEISMKGSGKDENKRLPMVWSLDEELADPPAQADYVPEQDNSVEDALKDKDSLLNHYKNVLKIRNSYPSISRGEVSVLDLGTEIFALDHGDVIVVHNVSSETVEIDIEVSKFKVVGGSVEKTKDGLSLEANSSALIVK